MRDFVEAPVPFIVGIEDKSGTIIENLTS